MTVRMASFLVLLWNTLAAVAAIVIFKYTGVDHTREGGFITILSILQLLGISGLSYLILRARSLPGKRAVWRQPYVVWGVISLGFLFLAADDLFRIHENADHLIHQVLRLQETPLSDSIDDALIGLYGLIGLGVLIACRDELRTYRTALPYIVCGFLLLFVMVAFDMITNNIDVLPLFLDRDRAEVVDDWLSIAEDLLKVFAEGFFIVAFWAVLREARRSGERATARPDG
jgi:hypothetical protein